MIEKHLEYFKRNNPFYKEMLNSFKIKEDDTIPTAGVAFDGGIKKVRLFINPEFFNSLTFKQQIAILEHEIQHITNYHIIRGKDKDPMVFNIAADIAINQYIKHLPRGTLRPTKSMRKKQTTEYYYNLLEDEKEKMKGFFKDFNKKYEEDSKKGTHEGWSSGDITEKDIKKEIDKALKKSGASKKERKKIKKAYEDFKKSQRGTGKVTKRTKGSKGDGTTNKEVRFFESLTPLEIHWKTILRKFVMDSFGRGKRNTIKMPNRRYPVHYGRARVIVKNPRGIIVIDISPSISEPLLKLFLSEVKKIFPLFNEMRIVLVDYEVRRDFVVKSKKEIDFDIKYGSGTDLCVVFDYLKNVKDYNFIIYFTDLEANIPTIELKPSIPTLWAVYGDYDKTDVEFGDLINLNDK